MLDYVTVTGGVMTDEEIQAYVGSCPGKKSPKKAKGPEY